MEQRGKVLRVVRQAERRAVAGGLGHERAEVVHLAHERKLALVRKRREVHVGRDDLRSQLVHRQLAGFGSRGIGLGRGLAQDRADARVRVLHVVHRVRRVLLLRHLDVEVDGLVGGLRQHEVAGRVHAHLVDELLERDHLARALGHAHGLAVAKQVHQLAEHDLKRAGPTPGGQHGLAAGDVAVVVGAPDVDEVVETALHLVVVIRHVAHEVRHLAVGLDEHAVLLVAERARLEPGGAVLDVDVALLVHGRKAAVDGALAVLVGLVEAALAEPAVERRAEALGHAMLLGQLVGVGALAEVLHALGRVGIEPLVAVFVDDGLSDVLHVRAGIAGFGHLHVAAEQLLVAHGHRLAEVVHLGAVIVDVELLVHVVAGMAHDARRGVAERGPAAMAHVHGAGGVGRDVLEVDLALALGDLALAEVALLGADGGHHALERRRLQADVDEAGARDLNRLDKVVLRQVVDDDLGDLARVLLGELRRAQSDGGRPVSVALVARTLEGRLRRLVERKRPILARGRHGRVDQLFKLFANLHCASSYPASFVRFPTDFKILPSFRPCGATMRPKPAAHGPVMQKTSTRPRKRG